MRKKKRTADWQLTKSEKDWLVRSEKLFDRMNPKPAQPAQPAQESPIEAARKAYAEARTSASKAYHEACADAAKTYKEALSLASDALDKAIMPTRKAYDEALRLKSESQVDPKYLGDKMKPKPAQPAQPAEEHWIVNYSGGNTYGPFSSQDAAIDWVVSRSAARITKVIKP